MDPNKYKLTELQAARLGAMTDLNAKELVGATIAQITDKFRFQIDPMILLFRKVCGRVVKKDPVTGTEYPVPNATVHVEDTDCSFLSFFPLGSPWTWFFPFHCHREVIATAKTDACGRFCVWIPRWDIDWVLRFRHERICFPIIFERPSIRDILEKVIPQRIPIPIPDPDPGPLKQLGPIFDRSRLIRHVEDQFGRQTARALDRLDSGSFGGNAVELSSTLEAAAFDQELPPPLPKEFLTLGESSKSSKDAKSGSAHSNVATTLARLVKLNPEALSGIHLGNYIGPFKRCIDIFVPQWVPIFDVPDITFRVTQDTDGDGVEETIYSEGYFQVRWNAGPLGPITIVAKPNARAGLECGGGSVPCGNVPAIVLAGRMPVVNEPTIYDPVVGYALRPNRPHPSGLINDPLPNPDGQAPFMGAVSLLGCNKTDPKATHYRVLFKYSSNNGVTFTSYTPFVGLTWPLFRLNAVGNSEWHFPAADSAGWYPIALPPGPNPFMPQDLLLDWPTYAFANGRYVLKLELGTGGVASSSSAEVAFNIDNAYPTGPLSVEWRIGGGAFQPLLPPCAVVRRGTTPADVEFRVTLVAAASHLRAAQLFANDCGYGHFVHVSGATEHWHTAPNDNSETLQVIYRLPGSAAQGTYSFSAHVGSRAFNPNGGDGGHLRIPPWEYDPEDRYIDPNVAFSVIDAN